MKKIAIVGIQGVPAKYGGFESLVENIIGDNCPRDVHYTVFCSRKDYAKRLAEYKDATLKYIPLHANGVQSIPYDMVGLMRSICGYDAIVVLGVSGCLFLPIFRLLCRKKLIVNIDGLEHRRAKWGKMARWVLRKSEAMAVRLADVVIADNKGIQDYVWETYHRMAELIAYGGDHVWRDVPMETQLEVLQRYGVKDNDYAITVCRIEPENNSRMILEAFARSGRNLVFIGNWEKSEYGRTLKAEYGKHENIHCVDAVYDLDTLYALRSRCRCYIHGHSAGGTNPSLVEAMFFGRPILAFDVVYNRETTNNEAYYFSSSDELVELLSLPDLKSGEPLREYARQHYTWKHIAEQYEDLY